MPFSFGEVFGAVMRVGLMVLVVEFVAEIVHHARRERREHKRLAQGLPPDDDEQ